MGSKTSDPVYIQKSTLRKIEEYLKTEQGKKLGLNDPKKAVSYILTEWLKNNS